VTDDGIDDLAIAGRVDLADAAFTLDWLARGGAPPACADAADTDDGGAINLNDAVYLFVSLFGGGVEPRPFAMEGVDPTDDDGLSCTRR
jgi:hypothetical protein